MYLPQETIRKKRDKEVLTQDEIQSFIRGVTDNSISEAQISALTMAIYLNGLSKEECVHLTLAMRDSGDIMQWKHLDLPGPIIDKHSTGGVGDTVSLMLGPLFAACGGFNPMISGRGLGHTGGTLDKLASIPGYNPFPTNEQLTEAVKIAGTAIIGQTGNLAPADKRIYAARDVTATVESIPLITASILSKKLAGGLDYLVMDVKTGSGAFMPTPALSEELARSIVSVGSGAGLGLSALLTDMNQSLAPAAGNAVEVQCAIDYLTGKAKPSRLHEVTIELCAEGLLASGLAKDLDDARKKLNASLDSGLAAEKFAKMVHILGGPSDILENPKKYLAQAPVKIPVKAEKNGYISRFDTRDIGLAVVALGGGRLRSDQVIDPAVGLTDIVELGQEVVQGEDLMMIHAQSEKDAEIALKMIQKACYIHDEKPRALPLIPKRISVQDL
jgi:thymidine phosphorylase